MKIIIVGGTPTALTLANLMGEANEITIIEQDPDKAKQIANQTSALVVEGDGTDLNVLNEAGLLEADAVVSTSDDKSNFMICEIALTEKVKKVIALVNEPKNEELFEKLGITQLVSAVGTNVTGIKNLLSQFGDVRIISQIGEGKVQIIEAKVGKGSPLISQPTILNDASIAAIYRSGELLIPKSDTVIREGDVLVIVAKSENINKIQDIIQGK